MTIYTYRFLTTAVLRYYKPDDSPRTVCSRRSDVQSERRRRRWSRQLVLGESVAADCGGTEEIRRRRRRRPTTAAWLQRRAAVDIGWRRGGGQTGAVSARLYVLVSCTTADRVPVWLRGTTARSTQSSGGERGIIIRLLLCLFRVKNILI